MISKKIKYSVILIIIAMLLSSTFCFAGDASRAGTPSGVQVQIPVGGRNMAMGGADLAMTNSLDAVYWNPAGLGVMEGTAKTLFSNMSYIADINISYFSAGFNTGKLGNLAVSVKNINFGEITQTTIDDPDGDNGTVFSPTFATLGLTWAKTLTDRINFGLTTKLIYESVPRASASSFAVDIGLQYKNLIGVEGLCLGVVAKNIGSNMQYSGAAFLHEGTQDGAKYDDFSSIEVEDYGLPSSLEIGLSKGFAIGDNQLLVGGNFVNNNFEHDNLVFGAEFTLMDMISLRGGYRSLIIDADNEDYASSIFGLTFGGGLQYQFGNVNLGIDYTFRQTEYFDNNNVFCLRIGF